MLASMPISGITLSVSDMKVIVAGSRDIVDRGAVWRSIESLPFPVTEIVSGTARGVDAIAESYANTKGIALQQFPADWDKYGKPAGAIRNKQMAEYADALIAVWDGQSRGTKNMIQTMNRLNKPVFLYLLENAG